MRRRTLLTCALAGLAALGQVVPADAAPRLRASLQRCAPGVAELRGAMPALPGARRMAMRFDLQAREPESGVWSALEAPGFGTWVRSLPRRAGFVYVKRVDGLAGPGAYRAIVRFRWTGPDGEVLRTARRTTPACEQDDRRPDLAPGALTAEPGPEPGTLRYRLEVRNEGAGPAGPSAVELDVGGTVVRTALGRLAVGRLALAELVAPACAAPVGVRLDPDDAVLESDEADNLASLPCPSVHAAGAAEGAR